MDAKFVVVTDVIDSSGYANFAAKRDQALERLARSQATIRYRHAITAWDEVQFLLERPTDLPEFFWQLITRFQPMQLRIGIGLGAVSVVEAVADGDRGINEVGFGPAFEAARTALEQLNNRGKQVSESNVLVSVHGSGIPAKYSKAAISAACNAILAPLSVLIRDISQNQWAVLQAWNEVNQSQTAAARALGVNVSTVSRSLNRANRLFLLWYHHARRQRRPAVLRHAPVNTLQQYRHLRRLNWPLDSHSKCLTC
ncbi:MAG: hypothetical protein AAF446_05230 [Pseudomonadota bacterium]